MKNTSDYAPLLIALRQCAHMMMLNSSYVSKELPQLDIPESLRAQINGLCDNWLSTKHDLISELFDAQEDMDAGKADALAARCGRMVDWIEGHIIEGHEIIQNMTAAVESGGGRDLGGACLLLTESAFNVLNSFNEIPLQLLNEL